MSEASPAIEESTTGSPSDFLKAVVGERVQIRLNSGVDYRGVLSCLDGYMNAALEETEEWVNNVKTNEYGDVFLRGNNGQSTAELDSSVADSVFFISVIYFEDDLKGEQVA